MQNLNNSYIEYNTFFKNDEDFNEAFIYEVNESQVQLHLALLQSLLKDSTDEFSIKVDNQFVKLENSTKQVNLAVLPTGDYVLYTHNKKTGKNQSYKRLAFGISLYKELVLLGVLENVYEKHLKFVNDYGYESHVSNVFKRRVDSLLKLANN